MDIEVKEMDGIAVAIPSANVLDSRNSSEFRELLDPILQGYTKVILDCRGVQFVDSSGIGSIVASLRKLNKSGGEMKLCSLTPTVVSLCKAVQLHKIVDILDTLEEAAKAFSR